MKKLIFICVLLSLAAASFSQLRLMTNEQKQNLESLKNGAMRTASVLVTYEDDSIAKDIVVLPDSAIVWDIDIRQITNFNDGGVDSLEVGTTSDPDYFVDMAVNTGAIAWDSVTFSNEPPYSLSSIDTIRVMYWGGDSDATAGQVAVYVQYTLE